MTKFRDKILYISLTNGAGGAEQILLMCAKVTGSKIIFLKEVKKSALFINDFHKSVNFLNQRSILLGFLLLIKELKNYRKDYIIISSHPYLNAYLGILKRIGFLKSQIASRECTSVFLRFKGIKRLSYKILYTIGYPAIDLFVCQTNEMKNQLVKNLNFLKERKVIVVHNPVDVRLILHNSELALDDPILEEDFICSAGRLITLKGFDRLISAFANVSQRYPFLKLIILGEGDERKNLQNLIERLGLERKIILKGFVSNPFPYFRKAKVCVVSSIREGFPNVLLQMMALNTSVVTTLCADGIEEINTIRKVNVGNQEDLINALLYEMEILSSDVNCNPNLKILYNRQPKEFINTILNRLNH